MIDHLHQAYKTIFHRTDGITFFSPGRVNLIGEHIDYNGGYVLPCAISFGTYGIAQKREDRLVSIYSQAFSDQIYTFAIDEIKQDKDHAWADYVKGSIKALSEQGYVIDKGIDLYMTSTMPMGSGLSSSASLEMLIITIFDHLFQLNISIKNKALMGKFAENKFVGVNSGIMDQFAVIAGKKDHAMLLNTDTLDHSHIPLHLGQYTLLIVNTNKKRGLADSKYNERFGECQSSLGTLKSMFDIKHLCELNSSQLPLIENLLDETTFRRTRHVITEQERTIMSTHALKKDDIQTFARLMNESHNSLRDDYEVTGIELDTLQEALLSSGALGARMTGAGFGGCVISIIPTEVLTTVKDKVKLIYQQKIGYEPTFYEVLPSEGTHLLDSE